MPSLRTPVLAVDQTGVGRAVMDQLRRAQPQAQLRPVVITGGHEVRQEGSCYRVPKKELVNCLPVLRQSRRWEVAPLPERELLAQELAKLRVKVSAGAHESFEAVRKRDHDDLVLAAWVAKRPRRRA